MDDFERRECPVCGAPDSTPGYVIHYESNRLLVELGLEAAPPEVRLQRCTVCPHHFASPHIATELLTRYYSQMTSEFYGAQGQPVDFRAAQHAKLVADIERRISGGNVLDIGYGHGFLLSQFAPERWTRLGVEPSRTGSRIAQQHARVDQHWDSFDAITNQNGSVDVVLLMDVVEHLPDVRPLLSKVRELLAPGGLLVIGTGNIRSLNAIVSRSWWGYFRSWEHVSFFSPASMRWALSSAGFATLEISHLRHAGGHAADLANAARNVQTVMKNGVKIAAHKITGVSRPIRNGALVHDHLLALATRHSH